MRNTRSRTTRVTRRLPVLFVTMCQVMPPDDVWRPRVTRSDDHQTSPESDSKLILKCWPPPASPEVTESLPALSQPTVAFKVSSIGAAETETILIGSDIYKISRVTSVPREPEGGNTGCTARPLITTGGSNHLIMFMVY